MNEFGVTVYAGGRQLRGCVADFLQYLFSNYDYAATNWLWTDDKTTKVTIRSSYGVGQVSFPSITVYSVRPDTRPMFLGDVSWQGDVSIPSVTGQSGDVIIPGITGYCRSMAVNHMYDVDLRISAYSYDTVEFLNDILQMMLVERKTREEFTIRYGAWIDPSTAIHSSTPAVVPMSGSAAQNEYHITLSFKVLYQGEVITKMDPEPETIRSEKVTDAIVAET
jgi:hypothetical protein